MAALPPLELLRPAADAARAALRAMDDEEVPAGLRKVAASSARRLPPPFAETLLGHVDRDDWLRDRTLQEAGVLDADDEDPAKAVSALFLRRPDGWRERIEVLVAARVRASERDLREMAEERVRKMEARIEALVAERNAAREAVGRAREEGRADAAAERDRLASSSAALRRELEEASDRAEEAGDRIRALEQDLAEADARIAELRQRAPRGRSERASDDPGSRGFGVGSAIETARTLDQLASAIRRGARAEPAPAPAARVELPAGGRPDDPEAVAWLLELVRPVLLVVDGYNVAHDLAATPDRPVRDRVHRAAERIRRLADGPVRTVVVWDSGEEPLSGTEGPVAVRYVPDADDAVVEEVAASDGDVVVVTSDRELRERAEAEGALVLWSSALVRWMSRG